MSPIVPLIVPALIGSFSCLNSLSPGICPCAFPSRNACPHLASICWFRFPCQVQSTAPALLHLTYSFCATALATKTQTPPPHQGGKGRGGEKKGMQGDGTRFYFDIVTPLSGDVLLQLVSISLLATGAVGHTHDRSHKCNRRV